VESKGSGNTDVDVSVPEVKGVVGGNVKVGGASDKTSKVTFVVRDEPWVIKRSARREPSPDAPAGPGGGPRRLRPGRGSPLFFAIVITALLLASIGSGAGAHVGERAASSSASAATTPFRAASSAS
jgi:hypothetical protein